MKNAMRMFMLSIMVFCGCATATVSSDFNRSTDFSKLKTYDWSSAQAPAGDIRFDDPALQTVIKQSVDAELQAKGFQKSTSGQPDLLLKYYVTVEQKEKFPTDFAPPPFNPRAGVTGMSSYAVRETTAIHYEEGTFVLDMTEPASGKILWRGMMQGMVDPGGTPEKRVARAPGAVAKVLAKFPPA